MVVWLSSGPAKAPPDDTCAPVFARLESPIYVVVTRSGEAIFFDLEDVKLSYRDMICKTGLYIGR